MQEGHSIYEWFFLGGGVFCLQIRFVTFGLFEIGMKGGF